MDYTNNSVGLVKNVWRFLLRLGISSVILEDGMF